MIIVCKKDIFASKSFGGDLIFIKNKKYIFNKSTNTNVYGHTVYKIACETDYVFSLHEKTFYEVFYTNKELRKIKLEKLLIKTN